MKARIVVLLFVLLVVAMAAFLLWRSGPSPLPAVPAQSESIQAKQEARASAPSESVDLGIALALDRLADCARSPALASVLDQMVRVDPQTFESRRGGPIRVPGYAQALVPTFERTREIEGNADIRAVVADLELAGRWHGLGVTGLRRSFYEESDVGAFQVRFAETPERVREVLDRQGFRLPPVGALREIDEEGMTTSLGIERSDGGAALTCTTG
ncbi:MAG TPA: hypothetical protein VLK25_11805 [Allosphingosinicella sp.]|nr:hypothetical protein [Allosphingosinicella sp.]